MTSLSQSRLSSRFIQVAILSATMAPLVQAAGPYPRRYRTITPTARTVAAPVQSSGFYGTPSVLILGNGPTGHGYSPFGEYGDHTMTLTGPFSTFRSYTAPVVIYARGYDGLVRPIPARSFSYPNYPTASPVVYPTRANNFFAPRRHVGPPISDEAINWYDQN